MDARFSRTELLLGKEAMEKLNNAHIIIFGIGGVGGFALEALVRSGVGSIDIVDSDVVSESNINRQIYALESTIGKYKVDVAKERIKEINPNVKLNTFTTFYLPETAKEFNFEKYDYIIDAIDTVTGKIDLIVNANKVNTPIISSMGTGNKLDPTKFEVADIYETSVCPLSRVMRRELKERGIKKLKVVYSKEEPIKTNCFDENKKMIPASISFVPSVAGLIIAGEVIKDMIKNE